ncbi:MAG: hypothetical protein LBI49_18205, partial [Nocardiopsaceae bacterium]|nr:hypothetical protein [Nocardiopsaceae bacterium]
MVADGGVWGHRGPGASPGAAEGPPGAAPDTPAVPRDAADLARLLRETRLLAIVRGTDPSAALASVLVLAEAGITVIEV